MSGAKELYLEAIGLGGPKRERARKAALDRAHKIREFEIDLYWKRATYFWILEAAVFAAVGLTLKEAAGLPWLLPLALGSLGMLTACASWLAAHGSKFWQRNWEHHIDMLEGEFEGNLYKTVFVNRSGIKWSLTSLNENLAFCFVIFWSATFIGLLFHLNPNWSLNPNDLAASLRGSEIFSFFITVLTLIGVATLQKQTSGVKGNLFTYPEVFDPGEPFPQRPRMRRGGNTKQYLVRREPSID